MDLFCLYNTHTSVKTKKVSSDFYDNAYKIQYIYLFTPFAFFVAVFEYTFHILVVSTYKV